MESELRYRARSGVTDKDQRGPPFVRFSASTAPLFYFHWKLGADLGEVDFYHF